MRLLTKKTLALVGFIAVSTWLCFEKSKEPDPTDLQFLRDCDSVTLSLVGPPSKSSGEVAYQGLKILEQRRFQGESKTRLVALVGSEFSRWPSFSLFPRVGVGCHITQYLLEARWNGRELLVDLSFACKRAVFLHGKHRADDYALRLSGSGEEFEPLFSNEARDMLNRVR